MFVEQIKITKGDGDRGGVGARWSRRTKMAKVVRMGKVDTTMMAPRFTGAELNVHWVHEDIKPNSYGCTGCGLVWSRKWQAESCEERGHVSEFEQRYGGRFEQMLGGPERHIGYTAYTRYAIGRDKAIREAVTA